MKCHLQCAEQRPTSPNTAPATQNCIPKSKRNCPKTVEASFTLADDFADDPTMIRTRSEHEIAFSPLGHAFCIENYNISRSGYLPRFHQILRLPRKGTLMIDPPHMKHHLQCACRATGLPLQRHQVLCLPRKMTLMSDNLQCAQQRASPSNLTECCTGK